MKVEEIGTEKLIPYEFNNRRHDDTQVDRIANSIKEFGFNQPIVIDESNVVLVGHGRLFAAQKLGLEKVPTVQIKGLSEAQKKAYRILDNKLQNDSTWDFNNLELELGFLEDNGFELEPWGLDDLRDLFPPDDTEIIEDGGAGALPTETYIKRGDLIELGPHRVMCGDSTSAEDVAILLNGAAVGLMVTDPPYGVEYDPEWRDGADLGIGDRARGKVANDDRVDWGEVFVLWNPQVVYCWHATWFTSEVQQSLETAGLSIIAQIIWAKQHFALSRGDYHWQHEPCWYAARDKHNWQGARDQSTLWEIKNNNAFGGEHEEKFGHGTQKPVECMARPIKNNSSRGEVVCDPFLGSGTTLIAAEELGRACYGMEIDPKYCQQIIERYRKFTDGREVKINGEAFNPPIKEDEQKEG